MSNFETGAKTAAVNDLILFIDTTRDLAEMLEKAFYDCDSAGQLPEHLLLLMRRAMKRYEKEVKLPIAFTGAEREDFISIMTCRFNQMVIEEENEATDAPAPDWTFKDMLEAGFKNGFNPEDSRFNWKKNQSVDFYKGMYCALRLFLHETTPTGDYIMTMATLELSHIINEKMKQQ